MMTNVWFWFLFEDELKFNKFKGMEAARAKAEAALFEHCAYYLKAISSN
jgi:hypothetical protein